MVTLGLRNLQNKFRTKIFYFDSTLYHVYACCVLMIALCKCCVSPVSGSFEIALLRLCSAYDVGKNHVIFGSSVVPLEAFSNLGL